MINVVAALIEKDNKYLIARRNSGSEYVLGKWEFPGGKVEMHETDHEAIEREIEEEFGVKIKSNRFLARAKKDYPKDTIELRLYECTYLSGEFKLHDHYEYRFVNLEDIPNYDLCELDNELIKLILKK